MGTGFDVATSPEEEGIIPRAVAHLFEGIDRRKHDAKERNEPQPDFKITVQFMEVHAKKNQYLIGVELLLIKRKNQFGDDSILVILISSVVHCGSTQNNFY